MTARQVAKFGFSPWMISIKYEAPGLHLSILNRLGLLRSQREPCALFYVYYSMCTPLRQSRKNNQGDDVKILTQKCLRTNGTFTRFGP